jgi:hypothetical protein
MSATVRELIGQIIDPRPASHAPAASRAAPAAPGESLESLIGGILAGPRASAAYRVPTKSWVK